MFSSLCCSGFADDGDDADDLRCNASDRIARLQDRLTCDLQKRSSSGIFFVSVFSLCCSVMLDDCR